MTDAHDKFVTSVATQSTPEVERPGAATGQRVVHTEIELLSYGDATKGGAEIVATLGEVELEYAAIRRGAGLFDAAQRATIRVTGNDRIEFLNRMLTNELKDLGSGMVRRAFWLNRKGRIESDLQLMETGDSLLIGLDAADVKSVIASLNEYLFAEDAVLEDASQEFRHLELHGRACEEILAEAGGFLPGECAGDQQSLFETPVYVCRHDGLGCPGVTMIVRREQAEHLFVEFLGLDAGAVGPARRIRPIGWYAYNIARIESGTPLFHVDFGPTNLPHETGVLDSRVSFTKGCYLGQEIVARMQSLGKPKQVLTGFRCESDALPVAGGQVFSRNADGSMGEIAGAVTSSALSPMLGATPVGFAMMKSSHAEPGTTVLINAEGQQVNATLTELVHWRSGS